MASSTESDIHGAGKGVLLEHKLNRYVGSYIHLFLTLLGLLVMAAATVATVELMAQGFPKLWTAGNEYEALHLFLQNILLVAIAGELALLLLFHRTSAAIEVVLFVIARRMVATDVTALDLLLGSLALAVLLIIRFYYLPGKPE
jgi:hypothetical protein